LEIKDIVIKEIFPIEKFNFNKFSEENSTCFTGSPIQHPYEDDKFILICDPLSDHTQFIEFSKSDMIFLEELQSIVTNKGENVTITKVWIKSGSLALRYEPFIVGKTKDYFGGFNKLTKKIT